MRRLTALLALIAAALLARPAAAQEVDSLWVAQHYVKLDTLIPMRDGVRLYTAIYLPKDRSRPHPVILRRTPYSVGRYGARLNGAGGTWAEFQRLDYIMVLQDVRGRYMSEGTFDDARPQRTSYGGPRDTDESTDTWDTIEWLTKNLPGNNGRVGMYGVSYPGFYSAVGAINAHPALKVTSPQAPVGDWWMGDDWRHNGALFLAHTFHFYNGFGFPRPAPTTQGRGGFDIGTPDGYRFFLELGPLSNVKARFFGDSVAFWDSLAVHQNYDEYWRRRAIAPHLRRMPPAVLTVGGWFDAEDVYGPFAVYHATERQNPGIANHLVVGPWSHGQWGGGPADQLGDIRFGGPTGPFFRDSVFLPFFRHHLEGTPDPRLAEAYAFETGTNAWRRYDAWPPRNAQPRALYLREGGALAWDAPAAAGADAHDEYVSDPARPVPHIGWIDPGMTYEYMTADQRFAATRPDVLVYQTPPLAEDVTVAGPIDVALHVSTSGTDSDWIVKVIDVFPDSASDPDPNPTNVRMGGYQQLIRGEPFRGRYRNSPERPEPFVPGQPARVGFSMPDVHHTFRRGHRIMIQVQSSWFPLVDRNPQTFVDIFRATEADFVKATQRVYRSAAMPSHVSFRVLPAGSR